MNNTTEIFKDASFYAEEEHNVQLLEADKEINLKCSCRTEGFIVTSDKEKEFVFYSWFMGRNSEKLSFKTKLKYVWAILFNGDVPFSDIILDKVEATKLQHFLNSNLNG